MHGPLACGSEASLPARFLCGCLQGAKRAVISCGEVRAVDVTCRLYRRQGIACLHGHSRPSTRAQTGLHDLCAEFCVDFAKNQKVHDRKLSFLTVIQHKDFIGSRAIVDYVPQMLPVLQLALEALPNDHFPKEVIKL